jgi:hypothetical protein
MADEATIELVKEIRDSLASQGLQPAQAKLYSQRVRLDMGREGLPSFSSTELEARLDEAILLLEAAWIERQTSDDGLWQRGVKRAAELLEWISQAALRPKSAPIHFLAAASYQLAGYPAMALGQLLRMPADEPFSRLLRNFLRGDFDSALIEVQSFWARQHELNVENSDDFGTPGEGRGDGAADLELATVRHVVMCLGTICAYLRTGEDALVERALAKLDALALSFLHSRDPYSYLLARLTSGTARGFVDASLWPHVERLSLDAGHRTRGALEQFARAAFVNRRALVWPAQREGIERLAADDSFVLCTPTGSGKTTIATLGAVQGLFASPRSPLDLGNLVLYLVPSRALAAEVETRFAEDLRGIAADPVVVTGLYGGADWGPTDAWVQVDTPTVVICTFEKADALLRYLGTLFLDRVRLIVIDEAHMVEQDPTRAAAVTDGTSRALRLEQLSARLLRAREEKGFRMIALSAVAAKAAPAIAAWLSGDDESDAIRSTFRSTRQMLGSLEVSAAGRFNIRYDLMDGRTLEFEDERDNDRPYVPQPFPGLPGGISTEEGPEVRMRAPTLWAAVHLAAARPDSVRPTVMISLTQDVSTWAATCADLMETWAKEEGLLPDYWQVPEKDPHWERCLAAAEDYFTAESAEYRLLSLGVAVHHGQMPALLARCLKVAIDRGHVRVVIATSTLSEGVNIPVNTILIPSLHRASEVLPANEFANLIGRAGRPGVSTEGSALVVLHEPEYERDRFGRSQQTYNRTRIGYESLVGQLTEATLLTDAGGLSIAEGDANSALAMLLTAIQSAWEDIAEGNDEDFSSWLEKTAVHDQPEQIETAVQLLDTLDGLLIAAVQEVEQLRGVAMSSADLESELKAVWRRTYARVAAAEEARLEETWLTRGRAITTLYPDPVRRRQLYKTSLPPRSGTLLLDLVDDLCEELQAGQDYARRSAEEQFQFIRNIIGRLGDVPAFALSKKFGKMRKPFEDWEKVLRWWLYRASLPDRRQPKPKELGTWFDYVAKNFIYRGNWGLGSLVGVLLDRGDAAGPVDALTIDDWPRSGLPWIAFWLKELINWGTLDPVAAFLLARGNARDREEAETDARDYYALLEQDEDANDTLDPRRIRDWVELRRPPTVFADRFPLIELDVVLERPAKDYQARIISVLPIQVGHHLSWIDPAGYAVARCALPEGWTDQPTRYRFELSVDARTVSGEAYLPHRP